MAKIDKIIGREILDSRATPTVEATVVLSDGTSSSSSSPSGASVGTYEAAELRDNDEKRFRGKGVLKVVENVNTRIAHELRGMEASDQQGIDKKMIELDGTQNKNSLGSNAILAVSQAVAKATAKSSLLPLSVYLKQFLSLRSEGHKIPTPLFNMVEGGKHANNGIDFQEFLVIPATSFKYTDALQMGVNIFYALRDNIASSNLSTGVADEGGFAPNFANNLDVLKAIKNSIDTTPYAFSKDIFLGIDAATNSIVSNKKYMISDRSGQIGHSELLSFYKNIVTDFSVIYLEDPFAEDDWEAWKDIYQEMGGNTLIVGDHLTSTNPYRLQMAINNNVINAIIVKPNQIGTVTEALAVVEMAKYKNLRIIVSHRSGETDDDFIADFAVAAEAEYVKFGAPNHERIIKYNRLLEIEQDLEKFNSL